MKPTLYIALTHDWELRGDGSGEIEQIQFRPMRELLNIYSAAGVRTTFLPDVMQQLTFRDLQEKHPELKILADKWDEHVREAFLQGHDIQLHLHPQWRDATYEAGRWLLASDWSLPKHSEESAVLMLSETKQYLEQLLRALDPSYKCIAFRAGALAIAPSHHLLSTLVKLGIVLDVSLAGGFFCRTPDIQLDFTGAEEKFLPFYPDLTDARKVSDREEKIVCVPLHHFHGSRARVFQSGVATAQRKIRERFSSMTRITTPKAGSRTTTQAKNGTSAALFRTIYEKAIAAMVERKYLISDTSRLTYPLLSELLASLRRTAKSTGLRKIPIVLTNHPKEIVDYTPIRRFIADLTQADDVRFITLSELARAICEGEFEVRKKSG